MAEFDLIERIRARAIARDGVLLGIGDDAALLQVPAGHELAVTADTLNAARAVAFSFVSSAASPCLTSAAANPRA